MESNMEMMVSQLPQTTLGSRLRMQRELHFCHQLLLHTVGFPVTKEYWVQAGGGKGVHVFATVAPIPNREEELAKCRTNDRT